MFTDLIAPSPLQMEIARLLNRMAGLEPDSEEYGELLDRLQKLHKMAEDTKPSRVSSDTVVQAATSILGILLITRYEYSNVITSKALGFVHKPKV